MPDLIIYLCENFGKNVQIYVEIWKSLEIFYHALYRLDVRKNLYINYLMWDGPPPPPSEYKTRISKQVQIGGKKRK